MYNLIRIWNIIFSPLLINWIYLEHITYYGSIYELHLTYNSKPRKHSTVSNSSELKKSDWCRKWNIINPRLNKVILRVLPGDQSVSLYFSEFKFCCLSLLHIVLECKILIIEIYVYMCQGWVYDSRKTVYDMIVS